MLQVLLFIATCSVASKAHGLKAVGGSADWALMKRTVNLGGSGLNLSYS